ncbi:HIT family protein [Desulfonauticus submarinus]|uniref:Diadenosine tetraphosphate (Ap4A) hydrolase n=1 Tax=Desulfonauticus submarinus TaxID=206665 RepID=A0A1H0A174_9BACT|nr:HIT domain-containing protein [Desulfonauticus submarinus]SDN27215.1 Diadenosine tetraphosphate (Ap4A) hydrolase [Desulfonauticus submarinus]
MRTLWAPWRIEYILGPKPDECVFCIPKTKEQDEERLILHRAEHCFVVMNKYPYMSGHIMVTPYRHVSCLSELTDVESQEIMSYLKICTNILKQVFNPNGINIGLNIGEAAGAGIEEHLHFHILPRWIGDHSFMAVINETSVIPEHLKKTYKKLKPFFNKI